MRDLKYIIKRILIGVGIILVLAYIRIGKSLALEDYSSYQGSITRTTISSSSVLQLIYTNNITGSSKKEIYQDRQTGDIVFCVGNNDSNCRIFYVSQISNFSYDKIGAIIYSNATTSINYDYIILSNESTLPKFSTVDPIKIPTGYNYLFIKIHSKQNSASYIADNCSLYYINNEVFDYNINLTSQYRSYNANVSWNYYSSSNANVNIENYYTSTPEFVSWNHHFNNQDGVTISESVSPEFSNFDTTNYFYQWKFGHDDSWKDLEENEQLLNFKNNGMVYVRIIDNNNTVIDNANFTIASVGKLALNNNEYNITFTPTYDTSLSNDSTNFSPTVKKVFVNILFTPFASNLVYVYKFVPDNESNDNWITLNDINQVGIEITENGILYAKILDENGDDLYSSQYAITNIGKLAPNSGNLGKMNGFWGKISNQINYGGPISSLIQVPINLIYTILGGLNSYNTCNDIDLGSLLGTHLYLPCVNVRSYLGNNLYSIIDIICSSVMIYYIFKMLTMAYDKFVNLEKDPCGDFEFRERR